jgi:hypothetical protein
MHVHSKLSVSSYTLTAPFVELFEIFVEGPSLSLLHRGLQSHLNVRYILGMTVGSSFSEKGTNRALGEVPQYCLSL